MNPGFSIFLMSLATLFTAWQSWKEKQAKRDVLLLFGFSLFTALIGVGGILLFARPT